MSTSFSRESLFAEMQKRGKARAEEFATANYPPVTRELLLGPRANTVIDEEAAPALTVFNADRELRLQLNLAGAMLHEARTLATEALGDGAPSETVLMFLVDSTHYAQSILVGAQSLPQGGIALIEQLTRRAATSASGSGGSGCACSSSTDCQRDYQQGAQPPGAELGATSRSAPQPSATEAATATSASDTQQSGQSETPPTEDDEVALTIKLLQLKTKAGILAFNGELLGLQRQKPKLYKQVLERLGDQELLKLQELALHASGAQIGTKLQAGARAGLKGLGDLLGKGQRAVDDLLKEMEKPDDQAR